MCKSKKKSFVATFQNASIVKSFYVEIIVLEYSSFSLITINNLSKIHFFSLKENFKANNLNPQKSPFVRFGDYKITKPQILVNLSLTHSC